MGNNLAGFKRGHNVFSRRRPHFRTFCCNQHTKGLWGKFCGLLKRFVTKIAFREKTKWLPLKKMATKEENTQTMWNKLNDRVKHTSCLFCSTDSILLAPPHLPQPINRRERSSIDVTQTSAIQEQKKIQKLTQDLFSLLTSVYDCFSLCMKNLSNSAVFNPFFSFCEQTCFKISTWCMRQICHLRT